MIDAFKPVRDFEKAVADYTGAPYVVAVSSCTMALLLAVVWHLRDSWATFPEIEIPKRTYAGVASAIVLAGGRVTFRDDAWFGFYDLRPLHVFDSARHFTSDMWWLPPQGVGRPVTPTQGYMICCSFHSSKTLGDSQGGCILHDNAEADAWFRRMRFDGRTEGVNPKEDNIREVGYHAYLSPDVAARLTWKLSHLPRHNAPLPNSDYADLSQWDAFK